MKTEISVDTWLGPIARSRCMSANDSTGSSNRSIRISLRAQRTRRVLSMSYAHVRVDPRGERLTQCLTYRADGLDACLGRKRSSRTSTRPEGRTCGVGR